MTNTAVILIVQLGLGFALGWLTASLFKLSKRIEHFMTDLTRLSLSIGALVAAAQSLVTLQNNTIAELRQIAGNTSDPDIQIQVNALADKTDGALQTVVAALTASDPDGDGEPNLDSDEGDETPPEGDTGASEASTTSRAKR